MRQVSQLKEQYELGRKGSEKITHWAPYVLPCSLASLLGFSVQDDCRASLWYKKEVGQLDNSAEDKL